MVDEGVEVWRKAVNNAVICLALTNLLAFAIVQRA